MRKIYLLMAGLALVGMSAIAQPKMGAVLIEENFDTDAMPPAGWSIDENAGNWSAKNSAKAGGDPYEARMTWQPQFNGISRLISPQIDLSGISTLRLQFNAFVDDYGGGYSIGVATRTGSGEWTDAWTKNVTGNIPAQVFSVDIDDNLGAADFQVCVFFSGDSYQLNNFHLDNIKLFSPNALDATLADIPVNPYMAQGDVDVKAMIMNTGTTDITSLEVNYQLNDGDVVTATENVNIAAAESYEYTFGQALAVAPGDQNLKVWFSKVNGGDDDDLTDNEQIKVLHVATESVQRLPLYEEFTSATCGPCANFNANTLDPLMIANEGKYTMIKYQMSWPSPGDPYYTEEGGVRRSYYGVNAVPSFWAEGENPSSVNQALFDNLYEVPALMEITAEHTISEDHNITVNAKINSFFNAENLILHTVVVENKTTENVMNNGETEFFYVMMKMMPDANGQEVDLVAGEEQTVTLTADLSGTNVEEWDDLSVVIFVQDLLTKQVFQSTWSDFDTGVEDNTQAHQMSLYPNPAAQNVMLSLNTNEQVTVRVMNSMGQVVYEVNENVTGEMTHQIDLDGFATGLYYVTVEGNSGVSTQKLMVK